MRKLKNLCWCAVVTMAIGGAGFGAASVAPIQSLDPAAKSPMGYDLLLPYHSLTDAVQSSLAKKYPLAAIAIADLGSTQPGHATGVAWGIYNGNLIIKTAKHVADKGITAFIFPSLTSLNGQNGAIALSTSATGVHKVFDDTQTDVTLYAFPVRNASQDLTKIKTVRPYLGNLAARIGGRATFLIVGRASLNVGKSDGINNPGLYVSQGSDDITHDLWLKADISEGQATPNIASVGGADVLAMALTRPADAIPHLSFDPDGIKVGSSDSSGAYVQSNFRPWETAWTYRGLGRLSGGSVLLNDKYGHVRDVANHITKGLPMDINNFSGEAFPSWNPVPVTGADGKTVTEQQLMTPAPFAYASSYEMLAKNISAALTANKNPDGSVMTDQDGETLTDFLTLNDGI